MAFDRETDLSRSDAKRPTHRLDAAFGECDVVGCRFRIKVWMLDQQEAERVVRVALDNHTCAKVPPSWPPQVGDVWMSEGGVLWAVGGHHLGLAATALNNGDWLQHTELDELLTYRPELVWRREEPT